MGRRTTVKTSRRRRRQSGGAASPRFYVPRSDPGPGLQKNVWGGGSNVIIGMSIDIGTHHCKPSVFVKVSIKD